MHISNGESDLPPTMDRISALYRIARGNVSSSQLTIKQSRWFRHIGPPDACMFLHSEQSLSAVSALLYQWPRGSSSRCPSGLPHWATYRQLGYFCRCWWPAL